METNGEYDQQTLIRERAVLKEWNYLQQSLLAFSHTASLTLPSTRRQIFENHIAQITERQALIRWGHHTINVHTNDSRSYEICDRHIRYGSLELAAGYLVSTFMPAIPRNFANLSALILFVNEVEVLGQYRLAQLPPSIPNKAKKSLTPREKDILLGLMRGECEKEIALRCRTCFLDIA